MKALLLLLVACTATSSPSTPDATPDAPACHAVDDPCPTGMHAMSCFVDGRCVFPGEPGEHSWVCCP